MELRTLVPWKRDMRPRELWLDDKLIEMGLRLIVEAALERTGTKVHVFNSFFYTKLTQGGYSYSAVRRHFSASVHCLGGSPSVRRWSKQGVLDNDLILIPIHLPGHWVLAVVNVQQQRIEAYDALSPGEESVQCHCEVMKRWVRDEAEDKELGWDFNDWSWQYTPRAIPMQRNSHDCGMFVLAFAAQIAHGGLVTSASINSALQHMVQIRWRLASRLLAAYGT